MLVYKYVVGVNTFLPLMSKNVHKHRHFWIHLQKSACKRPQRSPFNPISNSYVTTLKINSDVTL